MKKSHLFGLANIPGFLKWNFGEINLNLKGTLFLIVNEGIFFFFSNFWLETSFYFISLLTFSAPLGKVKGQQPGLYVINELMWLNKIYLYYFWFEGTVESERKLSTISLIIDLLTAVSDLLYLISNISSFLAFFSWQKKSEKIKIQWWRVRR